MKLPCLSKTRLQEGVTGSAAMADCVVVAVGFYGYSFVFCFFLDDDVELARLGCRPILF